MRRFQRVAKKRVECVDTKARFNLTILLQLYQEGVPITYTDKETGENLIGIIERLDKRKKIEEVTEELGPAEPFYKPKLNCCRMCGSVTVNRYNCTLCLDKIQENIDDNFILFTSGSTSDVESPDWGGTIDA